MDLEGIFAYPAQRARQGEPEFEKTYLGILERFSRKYHRYRPLIALLEGRSGTIRKVAPDGILFLGTSFLELMLETGSRTSIATLAQDEKELLTARRHAIPRHLAWKWKSELYRARMAVSAESRLQLLARTVEGIEAILRSSSPRAVVVKNDSLFLERAVIAAARLAGIPTVTIQHGLFMQAAGMHNWDGYWTDHMLVWGEFFRDLYLEWGIVPEERIHVLGYPFPVATDPGAGRIPPRTLCLLGQPWELNSEALREEKHRIIGELLEGVARDGLELVYRPHPAESRSRLRAAFPSLRLTDEEETLTGAIGRWDLFLSWTSTALIEVALHGRSAVQIGSETIPMDDFGAAGACHSIAGDRQGIRRFLEGAQQGGYPPMPVSDSYIHHDHDIAETFSSILGKISGQDF